MAKPIGGELDSASRSGGQRWQAEVAEGAAARARVPIRRLPTPWRRVAEAAAEAALPVRPQVWPEVLASCAPCLQRPRHTQRPLRGGQPPVQALPQAEQRSRFCRASDPPRFRNPAHLAVDAGSPGRALV